MAKKKANKTIYNDPALGFNQGWKDMLEGRTTEYKTLPKLVKDEDIQFNLITELANSKLSVNRSFYDALSNITTIYFVDKVESMDTVVHYLTDKFALIYNSNNMEFIGIHIEK